MVFYDLLFPVYCLSCGVESLFLCGSCEARLVRLPPVCFYCGAISPVREGHCAGQTCRRCSKKGAISGFLSPFLYRDPLIQEIIHQLKYERILLLAPILGSICARYVLRHQDPRRFSALIPLPLYASRERVRGFNQSALIAQECSRISGVPLHSDALARIKKQRPQVGLSHEERKKNIAGVFVLQNGVSVVGKRVFLLDDVKTSGATLEEAAKVLKRAGAEEIWAITVAR